MTRYEWKENEDRKPEDPYFDWIVETGAGTIVTDGWTPQLIVTEPLQIKGLNPQSILDALMGETPPETEEDEIRDFGKDLGTLIDLVDEDSVYVNLHDFNHWIKTMLDGEPAELILFTNGQESLMDLREKFAKDLKVITLKINPESGATLSKNFFFDGSAPRDTSVGEGLIEMLKALVGPSQDEQRVVISGVIDHAIGFANERFRNSSTDSRVQAIWIQQAVPQKRESTVLGKLLHHSDINALLSSLEGGEFADEFDLYRASGAITSNTVNPGRGDLALLRPVSHGTQVLDLAAGYDADECIFDGVSPAQNPIIAVQLPSEIVATTNGFLHQLYVKSAMNFIWHTTLLRYGVEGVARLVVNYSFGDYSGRHDGQGMLDSDFENRIKRDKVGMITVPMGNGFNEKIHAEVSDCDLMKGTELGLMIQPDDKQITFMQFWLDGYDTTLPIEFLVTPPGCPTSHCIVDAANASQDLVMDGEVIARIYYQEDTPSHVVASKPAHHPRGKPYPTPRTRVTLAIRPTASDDLADPLAPAGRWKLTFKAVDPKNISENVHLWVERGDTIDGFPQSGRQAYLVHPMYEYRSENGRLIQTDNDSCPIRRFGTISPDANAPSVLAAGAIRKDRRKRVALYSAANFAGQSLQPSLSMNVELSAARPNVITTGTASGTSAFFNGTSAASAYAARQMCHQFFAHRGPLELDLGLRLKKNLESCTESPPNPPRGGNSSGMPTFPVERIGVGLLGGQFDGHRRRAED